MELKQEIEKILEKNAQGLSIADLEKRVKKDRVAIKVALAHLIGAKLITERKVGNTLLHYHINAFKSTENIE